MVKTVTGAGRPEVAAGAEAVYRALFDSFSPDQNGRISPLEVLSRLEVVPLPRRPHTPQAAAG